MSRTPHAVTAALLLVLGMTTTIPAAAQDAEDPWEPNLVNLEVYAECVGTTGVDNLSRVEGQRPGWTTERPTGSLSDGEGCRAAVDGITPRPCREKVVQLCPVEPPEPGAHLPALQWSGEFDGNLQELTVRLYAETASSSSTLHVKPALWVDDVAIDLFHDATGGVNVPVTPTEAEGVSLVEFSIGSIGLLAEEEDRVHDVRFELHTPPVDGLLPLPRWVDLATTRWLWGASEAPSGIEFNPGDAAETRFDRKG